MEVIRYVDKKKKKKKKNKKKKNKNKNKKFSNPCKEQNPNQ
jgi:hypothetical protein